MSEKKYTVDFGENGGNETFSQPTEIIQWLNKKLQSISWIAECGSNLGNSVHGQIKSQVKQLVMQLQKHAQQSGFDSLFQNTYKAQIENTYNSNILSENSPKGLFIKELRASTNERTAAAAYSLFVDGKGHLNGFQHADEWIGLIRASDYLLQRDEALPDTIKTHLARLDDDFTTSLKDSRALMSEYEKEQEERINKLERAYDVAARQGERLYGRIKKKQQEEIDAGINSLKDVETTYKEFMKLRSPVDYWSKKGSSHAGKAKKTREKLIGFCALGGLVVIGLSAIVYYLLGKTVNEVSAQAIFLGSVYLLIVSVFFWIGRVMVRIYLSEHHLAIDAQQRATMAETYLALVHEEAADEKDRSIVLAALFRATTDGIIKDDSAPTFSIPGIISGHQTS